MGNTTYGCDWIVDNHSNRELELRNPPSLPADWIQAFHFPRRIPAGQSVQFHSEIYTKYRNHVNGREFTWEYLADGVPCVRFVAAVRRMDIPIVDVVVTVHDIRYQPRCQSFRYNHDGCVRIPVHLPDRGPALPPNPPRSNTHPAPTTQRKLSLVGDSNVRRLFEPCRSTDYHGGYKRLRDNLACRAPAGWLPEPEYVQANANTLAAQIRTLRAAQQAASAAAATRNIALKHYNVVCVGWAEFDDLFGKRDKPPQRPTTPLVDGLAIQVQSACLPDTQSSSTIFIYNGGEYYLDYYRRGNHTAQQADDYARLQPHFLSELAREPVNVKVFNNAVTRRMDMADVDGDRSGHLGDRAEPLFADWIMSLL